eukprot:TRINITY_DN46805_c0_g1_i1.p2 TRINITY_DN46805_c0_g1~~TRINITY_DN46805_c0_g1_i1.p2  ORF type:complete len:359 (+),score=33.11 TRINITY_DN46805_c0_g1_i1:17-1093(+)
MDSFFNKQKQKPQQPKKEEIVVNRPWVEKYRPATIADIVFQDEVTNNLKKSLSQEGGENLTHLLFHGPPGTGKTSTILAICKELFGPEYYKNRVKELNASDDRGIKVIREKVKAFAQTQVSQSPNHNQSDGKWYPVPPFKVIILDEADALLPDAQAALRRMMEDFTNITRFCLCCNYVSKIIAPVASRCAKYRFRCITKDPLRKRLREIAEKEKLLVDDNTLETLDMTAKGDMRAAITIMQSAAKMFGDDLTKANFLDIAGIVPHEVMTQFFNTLFINDFVKVEVAVRNIIAEGYAAAQILSQLHDCIVDSTESTISSLKKAKLMFVLATAEKSLQDGAEEYLQILNVSATAMKVLAS